MDDLDALYADRLVGQTILLAYQRKLARLTCATEREYRAQKADVEEQIECLELMLADNSERIVDAWLEASKVKPTDIPQPWIGGAA